MRFTLFALIGCGALASANGAEPPAPVGAKILDFTATDAATGKPWTLAENSRTVKATVVVFLNTGCPVSTAYVPTLEGLYKQYSPSGVAFVGVFSHELDTLEAIRTHAKGFAIPFPAVRDDGTSVADKFAVDRIPTAYVLDAGRVVRYAGRVDDQFAPGLHKLKPTTRELGDAIDAVLAGREVKTAAAPAAGCKLTRKLKEPPANATVTYHKHVLPIIQVKCQDCHRSGEAGPFALTSYKETKGWAEMMREVVADGTMPPWHADAPAGHFRNDRRLSAEEKKTVLDWIDAGCPEGDVKDAPPPRKFLTGWRLAREPDEVLRMNRAVEVPASSPAGTNAPYEYVPAGPRFTEDKWVTGVEVRPEYRAVVHHIIVFIMPPLSAGTRMNLDNFGEFMLAAYAPGDEPLVLPEGMARKVPKGSQLIFEMHYTPNGKPGTDRSMIGLQYAKTPPKHEVLIHAVKNQKFLIPPETDNYEVKSEFAPRKSVTMLNFTPHMHLRGKSFRMEGEAADGTKTLLVNVPRYDFNWQTTYIPATPPVLPAGGTIRCSARFDNSRGNPVNPDPLAKVRWGRQTWHEMMIGFVTYYENE